MSEEIGTLLTKKKRLRMNGKMMPLTFLKLYAVYIKNGTIHFPYLLVNLFKERYISSLKSCKHLNKLTIKYKKNGLNFLKKNYVYAHNPFNRVSEKEKYTSHTMARLLLFPRAFCDTRVQNLLKGPDNG